jgi:putative peptide zinc metalloprotease protein
LDDETRTRQNVTREELMGARTELSGTAQERRRYEIRAPFAGVLVDVGTELRPGVWVNKQERLGLLINPAHWQVETFLNDSEIHRVKLGDRAKFYSESSSVAPLEMRVIRIDPDATRQLHDALLSSQHGGQILTRERNEQLIPEQALYRVVLRVEQPPEAQGIARVARGRVVISGERRSLLGEFARSALSVLIREANW